MLKLCDLGVATSRSVDEEPDTLLTRTNIGTDLYMSPENVRIIFKFSKLIIEILRMDCTQSIAPRRTYMLSD